MDTGLLVLVIALAVVALVVGMAWMFLSRSSRRVSGTAAEAAGRHHAVGQPPLVEPTWGRSVDGGPPVSELAVDSAGALNPFGADDTYPLPPDRLRYAHPTSRPNRAGLMAATPRGQVDKVRV